MTLTDRDILEVIRIFNESDAEELRLEKGELKLTLRKGPGRAESWPDPPSVTPGPESGLAGAETLREPPHAEAVPSKAGKRDDAEDERLQPVKAPLMGIFYRAPKPGAPPFVEVGSEVTEVTTLCIIEVMKLFTGVKAGVRGRIAKICAENSQLVEYGQTIFLVEPSEQFQDPTLGKHRS